MKEQMLIDVYRNREYKRMCVDVSARELCSIFMAEGFILNDKDDLMGDLDDNIEGSKELIWDYNGDQIEEDVDNVIQKITDECAIHGIIFSPDLDFLDQISVRINFNFYDAINKDFENNMMWKGDE